MNNQSHLVKLGFFVFLTISILVVLVFWFSWNTVESRKGLELNVRFRNVKGLVRGADVRQNGVRVGTVNGVYSDASAGGAMVVLGLYRDIKVPNRSYYSVNTGSLLGDASLDIYTCPTRGKEDPDELTGDENSGCNENVPTGFLEDKATAVGIYEATPNLDDAVKELEGVIKQLRTTTLLGVNRILEEMNVTMEDIGPKLSSTIGNIDKMTQELRISVKEITSKTDGVVSNLNETTSNIKESTRNMPEQLNSILKKTDETVSSLKNEIDNLQMDSRLDGMEKGLKDILDDIEKMTSSLSEESFLQSIKDTTKTINETAESINSTFTSINEMERTSDIGLFYLKNESQATEELASEISFTFAKENWYIGLNHEWWENSDTNFFSGLRNENFKLGAGMFRGSTAAEFSREGKKMTFQSIVWWPDDLDLNLKIKLGIPISEKTNIVLGFEKIQNSEENIFTGLQHNF